jgi:hypothetical protein
MAIDNPMEKPPEARSRTPHRANLSAFAVISPHGEIGY